MTPNQIREAINTICGQDQNDVELTGFKVWITGFARWVYPKSIKTINHETGLYSLIEDAEQVYISSTDIILIASADYKRKNTNV